jgi:hypothetical protein
MDTLINVGLPGFIWRWYHIWTTQCHSNWWDANLKKIANIKFLASWLPDLKTRDNFKNNKFVLPLPKYKKIDKSITEDVTAITWAILVKVWEYQISGIRYKIEVVVILLERTGLWHFLSRTMNVLTTINSHFNTNVWMLQLINCYVFVY